MKVTLTELRKTALTALGKQGYDAAESKQILEVLMYAQLRGNNQGVVKLIGPGIPNSADAGKVEITKDTAATAVMDAHHVHPMIAVRQAAELAAKKAKASGIAVVGVNHVNTSSGAIGFYARAIAEAGLVGVVMSAGPETVAPAGSTQAVFGTNPIAIAVPGPGEPVVLDFTTASMAFYGVVEANAAGRKLPEGIAYDEQGRPSTSAAEVLNGALKPFDQGVRGSGLSMMVQLLAGPLVGAGSSDMTGNWGHLVLAIDPEVLGGAEALREGVGNVKSKVKAARKLEGVHEVLVPGERGDRLTAAAEKSGELEVEDNLWKKLQEAAAA